MTPSAACIEANHANAELSTGRRATEGKQRAALKAIRHGLTTQQNVIPGEGPRVYQEFSRWLGFGGKRCGEIFAGGLLLASRILQPPRRI